MDLASKRNGDNMLTASHLMLHLAPESIGRAKSTLTKALYLKRIKQLLRTDPEKVVADLETAGGLRPTQASLAKFHNTRAARRVAATARDLLGGNGILLENGVMQHMADIEAIHTYEGTESVQALLLGRDITGVSAFA